MRNDMHKVLTEPARRGGTRSRLVTDIGELDELPMRQSMRRRHTDRKSRNETIRPLVRFLASRVGSKWDDVFSEICREASLSSFTQRELRTHLDWLVETHVTLAGDKPQNSRGLPIWARDFWVHPVSGALVREPDRPRRRWERRKRFCQLPADDSSRYVRLDGIWYRLSFAPIPNWWEEPVRDVAFGCLVRHPEPVLNQNGYRRFHRHDRTADLTFEWGAPVYAAAKQQIGKRELRKLQKLHGKLPAR